MRILYLAHDLSDPAIAQRVTLLRNGGAEVRLLGFRRSTGPVREVGGVAAIDLGRTSPGRLGSRCLQVVSQSCRALTWGAVLGWADVVLARNLEMLTIADAARTWARSTRRLAYECLDIHPVMLGTRLPSRLLRGWERRAIRRSDMLIVSSSGFLTNYFDHLGVQLPDVIIAENKLVLPAAEAQPPRLRPARRGPPWRIGWFGYLRCIRSLMILLDVARRWPDRVIVELRGRPTPEVQALIDQHLPIGNMRFAGPYAKSDLSELYGRCDLAWGVDYSQTGQNSDWLLPNRLYEAGYYGVPVIALAGTEAGAWLRARNSGILMRDPAEELSAFIGGLSCGQYQGLLKSVFDIPLGDLVWTHEESQRFAVRLAGEARNRVGAKSIPAPLSRLRA